LRVLRISLGCLLVATAGCTLTAGKPAVTPIPDAGSPGALTFSARCGGCHALPHPERLSYQGWLRLLPLMERRIAERGMPPLSETERSEILVYLKAHAR
jgi:hypothetical protein